MIVSASYRTDIPAFYADWFRHRLSVGHALVRNPYGGQPYRIDLRPDAVTGYVFWSRNIAPFEPALQAVWDQGKPFLLHFTLTGYPRPLERSVLRPEAAIDQMRRVCERYGPRAVVWRYDPILLSSLTPPAWHVATLDRLAGALRGVTDEVTTSFLEPYRKTTRNTDAAARRHGFHWWTPEAEARRALLEQLAAVAHGHGLAFTLCTQPALEGVAGTAPAACVDAGRLSDVAGAVLPARRKGNRPGCYCAESRDLGAYDTCPHGCVYCYAVSSPATARRNRARHDPNAETLSPA